MNPKPSATKKNNKKILFFNSHKAWGGGEKWHVDMAQLVAREGYDVVVAAHPGGELARRSRSAGLSLVEIAIGNLSFLNPFKHFLLYRLFRRANIDCIILNLPADLKTAGVVAWLAGIRRIIYRRGSAIAVRNTWLNRFLFRTVLTDVIANSEETKRTVLANNRTLIPEEKIHVIYNGINLSSFDVQTKTTIDLRHGAEVVLGHVGRLSYEKNQKFLIDVVHYLKLKGESIRLFIVGEGGLEVELKRYAADLGVAEEVVFSGFCDEVAGFLTEIDMFLLSSHWEGFGYVLVEAMAAAKPVVAFNSSSTPEVVQDGITGFLVPAGDLDLFVQRVIDLANNEKLKKTMGQAGRNRVEQMFTTEIALQKFCRLINSPLKQHF